jgi:hypothetical protein
MEKIKTEVGETVLTRSSMCRPPGLFDDIIAADTLAEFLTLKAYDHLEEIAPYMQPSIEGVQLTLLLYLYQEAR